jgi:hypothetical protein
MMTLKKHCPACRGPACERIPRNWWMRLLPWSRFYLCHHCGHRFVRVFKVFSFTL